MSSAEFVRNPDANTSVYRWEAAGIDELTRENKLTSLPFWIPNATTRRHQFRLVLLRGLVPSADPARDAFGLLVELIPPPSPAAENGTAAAAASTSSSHDFPGGCAVTCAVLPLDAIEGRGRPYSDQTPVQPQQQQEKAISSTKTAVIDATNTQVSFPDLVPAELAKNPRYVSGTPKSLTLQVTIETGISVPLHQVATTAYSFFSSLSSSVSQLLGTTTHLVHEGRENLGAMLSQAAKSNTGSSRRGSADGAAAATTGGAPPSVAGAVTEATEVASPPPPWECVPEEFRGHPEAWRSLLCVRLAGLDGTYRHGVEKTLSTAEVALLTEVGLSETDLWSYYALFDFDRDVQENLLSAPIVRARRYALVPARLKEEAFWANFFWKVHCVGQCVTERQVSAVVAALCTPSRADDADLARPVEEVLRVLVDAGELTAVLRDFMSRSEAGESWCSVVAETARQCVAVLHASGQRSDLSAHTRQQLSKALTELQGVLSSYGAALATPPSTPDVVAAEPVAAAVEAALHLVPPVDLLEHTAEVTAGDELPPSTEGDTSPPAEDVAVVEVAAAPTAEREEGSTATPRQETSPSDASPPSPTAPAPAAAAVLDATPVRSEAARSTSRIEFAKMPWEEEDA